MLSFFLANKKSYTAILIITVLLFGACTRHIHPSKNKVSWEENFNQPQNFDTSKWSKIPRGNANWNRHMSDFDSCYAMHDGKLVLRGIANNHFPNDTAKYLTGGVYTKDKVSFGFGRLEIRAKLNNAQGAWPAFWLLAQNAEWPGGGEIDIMEHLNSDTIAYQTVHSYYTLTLKMDNNPPHYSTGKINLNDFNIYAVEKHRDSLVFFINNKKTFSYPRIKTDKESQFPFDQHQHYLLLDMQLGGDWVGRIEPKDLPVEMEVDWVRFYEFKDQLK